MLTEFAQWGKKYIYWGLQLVDEMFLYFHFNTFREMSLKIIGQRSWGFDHSLIDGFFIFYFFERVNWWFRTHIYLKILLWLVKIIPNAIIWYLTVMDDLFFIFPSQCFLENALWNNWTKSLRLWAFFNWWFIYLFIFEWINWWFRTCIYIYIYVISPLVCITLIQTTGLIVIWKEVPNFCGIQHLGYRILLGLFSITKIIWRSQHNIYKRKC